MKRFTLLACAGLLTAAMVAPSLAADLPRPAFKSPVYVAPFSWSGFYVGINGGYAWGTANMSNVIGTQSLSPTGGLVGVTLGYNMQTGNWVWGVEGDIDAAWFKGTSNVAPLCAGGSGCEIKSTWFSTIRGRVGYAFDRWLPYFTGGLAVGDTTLTAPNNLTQTDTRTGWTIGGGLEWAFMGAWSAKVEYLYADLGSKTCPASVCVAATDVSLTENLVRVGVNYRF